MTAQMNTIDKYIRTLEYDPKSLLGVGAEGHTETVLRIFTSRRR
jgi:hypothetical protein